MNHQRAFAHVAAEFQFHLGTQSGLQFVLKSNCFHRPFGGFLLFLRVQLMAGRFFGLADGHFLVVHFLKQVGAFFLIRYH